MQAQQLLKLARKWLALVLLTGLIGGAVAYVVSKHMTPLYSATGQVLVGGAPGTTTDNGVANADTNPAGAATAAALLINPAALTEAISHLKLHTTEQSLAGEVSAVPESATDLIDVTVKDPSAARATVICNLLMNNYVNGINQSNQARVAQAGQVLVTQIQQVQAAVNADETRLADDQANGESTTQAADQLQADSSDLAQLSTSYSSFQAAQAQSLAQVSVASAAIQPMGPSSPITSLNTMLGGFLGLLVGMGMVMAIILLDQGLHTEQDVVERLAVPLLGAVPKYAVGGAPAALGSRADQRTRAAGEAYRRLRTNLVFSSLDAPLKTIVVTSVRAGEGKTRTAANLAVALAGADKRVLLIDADLRRPRQHRIFQSSSQPGVSDILVADVPASELSPGKAAVATAFPNLHLLPCGSPPPNPAELLASARTEALVHRCEQLYDMVIIDTPPVDAITDSFALAAQASATILIVEAGRTNATQAGAAISALAKVGANIAGVVLNKARERDFPSYYGYYDAPERAFLADDNPPPRSVTAASTGGSVSLVG